MNGVALVTGASRGVGRAVAQGLTAAGHRVIVAARGVAALGRTADELGATALALDVTDAVAVDAAISEIERRIGPIELLVNNAGVADAAGVSWEHEPAEWWRTFEVNVLGVFLCTRAVMPAMLARRSGRIVNIASSTAFTAVPADVAAAVGSAYMASKAAVIRFTEALAAEARPGGVSVFAVSPGTVRTDLTAALFPESWDDPGHWASPELGAELIAAIASGALDALSGRYIHATADDWRELAARSDEIVARDLHVVRLRTEPEPDLAPGPAGDPDVVPDLEPAVGRDAVRCSFCGKPAAGVESIVCGPTRSIAICDECVELVGEIMAEQRGEQVPEG